MVALLKGPPPKSRREVRYAKLKTLLNPGEDDLGKAFAGLADALASSGEEAEVEVDVVRGRTTHRWTVSLQRKDARATEGEARRPDLHVLVGREAWQEIAEGSLSPVEAFLDGRLRLRGDTELAKRLLRRAGGSGEIDVCR